MPRTAMEKQKEQLRIQYKLCSVITASSSASSSLSFRELTNCGELIKCVRVFVEYHWDAEMSAWSREVDNRLCSN